MSSDISAQEGELPLRADARRNRDQIISAAKAIFAAEGPDAPMEAIARRAAVGVGTLYRRFPDREALIRAVARDNFANALAHARAAAAEHTGWEALVRLLEGSEELQLSVHLAMLSPTAWKILKSDEVTQELRAALLSVLEDVVHAAQAEGSMRTDVGAGDVAATYSLLLRRTNSPSPANRLAADRALIIMLDGLRTSRSELPGHPLQVSEVHPT
ncbi:TetR/AcrR family transcriptional regulator [Saccharopolyspora gloriosae]|uniref:TetR/AcrR family transcriptional regulator n=1 Tax=Saccharopolyspora gloriosae TaxID=455344 RepID=UPI001FB618FD|nr:TetR/AcrR family transcriptional regulator [Saccharopolyspora gloriosae]